MILKFPRDLCEYPQFHKLKSGKLNQAEARWILWEWWDFLGYCCSITGHAGVAPKDLVEMFNRKHEEWELLDPIAELADAGWIQDEGDVWWCPVWQRFNYDLDVDFVEMSSVRRRIGEWQKEIERIQESSVATAENFPPEWFNVTERPADRAEMNRAVILIKTLDTITGRARPRGRHDWSRGTLTAAVTIIREWHDWKIKAVLRQAWFSRQRHDFPTDTDFCIANWDQIVYKVMPHEGWSKYQQRRMFERSGYAESEKL